ncbi:glycosyltransferase [Lachnobacterium bovis]|uniref:glycosyltransferase family protein n=1 Tax=Lachnobacterium bovis TaxID=140626 RepID=UPI0003B43438|nr:glycosyltransferase [Lachnobacterium bovis]
MKKIKKAVLLKGDKSNWGHASEEIALELEKRKIDTYFIDYTNIIETISGLDEFIDDENAMFITFNFRGLNDEIFFQDEDSSSIWSKYSFKYINILTDHPSFFHDRLIIENKKMVLYCIDYDYVEYIKNYYPKSKVFFLEMAGNLRVDYNMGFIGDDIKYTDVSYGVKYRDYEKILDYGEFLLPIKGREMDVTFIGNYIPVQNLLSKMECFEEFKVNQVKQILILLSKNKKATFEEILKQFFDDEKVKYSDEEFPQKVEELSTVNLCLRTIYREKLIRTLTNEDIKIHVFGDDWDSFKCDKPWNIIRSAERVDTNEAVKIIQNSKISLNSMPLLKNGVHERVLTAMLQKAVAVTDSNEYIEDNFEKGKDIVTYDLNRISKLPKKIKGLLENEELMQNIADRGYIRAHSNYMWKDRVDELLKHI